MPDRQLAFDLAASSESAPAVSAAVPQLHDEIAQAWGIPLGQIVEITFRPAFPVPAVTGRLELLSTPDFPWDPRQPLRLRIAGFSFSTRDIERWSLR